VHYPTGPHNRLFGSVRGMDRSVHFQFEGQIFLFSKESTPKRDALIIEGDRHILRIIISTAIFEGSNRVVLRKPSFIFGDKTPDLEQLLAGEDQWVFKIEEDKYYLPSSKLHFPLSFFKLVMKERKMEWHLTGSMDSMHMIY